MIGWNPWSKKRGDYLSCIEGKGGGSYKDINYKCTKCRAICWSYYKISFFKCLQIELQSFTIDPKTLINTKYKTLFLYTIQREVQEINLLKSGERYKNYHKIYNLSCFVCKIMISFLLFCNKSIIKTSVGGPAPFFTGSRLWLPLKILWLPFF